MAELALLVVAEITSPALVKSEKITNLKFMGLMEN